MMKFQYRGWKVFEQMFTYILKDVTDYGFESWTTEIRSECQIPISVEEYKDFMKQYFPQFKL
jgi:hypothetical protein